MNHADDQASQLFNFGGAQVAGVVFPDGNVYLHFDELCHGLGFDLPTQLDHWQQHPVLQQGLAKKLSARKEVDLVRFDLLPFWFITLNPVEIPEAHKREILHQQEAAKVCLFEAFSAGYFLKLLPLAQQLKKNTPAARAYQQALNQLAAARDQLLIETFSSHSSRKGAPC